jgi:cobalt-zinc-cadmium efflux system membrane fusion protein
MKLENVTLLRLAEYRYKTAPLRSRLSSSFRAATVRKRFFYGGNCHCIKQTSIILCLALGIGLTGCTTKAAADGKAGEPPPTVVEHEENGGIFKVDHPERFPLAAASRHDAAPELRVTGSVNPDVSRNVPVISLASGRIIEVHTRLGDSVTKGQLLMKVQSADISQAFSDYRQAKADLTLALAQLDRAKVLYEKGAIAQKDLEIAVDTEVKARVTVQNTEEKIHVLGADVDHPSTLVNIYAPVSGVITDQQVTAAAGTQGLASPNPFTIADLSHVWIICDVYENDLPFVRLGEYTDIHLNAYPNLDLKGRIGNISPALDPNLRTAKVRLEVQNSGILRFGMFVTAVFHGLNKEMHVTVPATAVLHLHDRDWVYVPVDGGQFRGVEVVAGQMLPGNIQEIVSGIQPGEKVIESALVFQSTVEQK